MFPFPGAAFWIVKCLSFAPKVFLISEEISSGRAVRLVSLNLNPLSNILTLYILVLFASLSLSLSLLIYTIYSPIIRTSTLPIFEDMKSSSIPHNNFPIINLRYELRYSVAILADSEILHYPNDGSFFSTKEPKSNSQLFAVVSNSHFLLVLYSSNRSPILHL